MQKAEISRFAHLAMDFVPPQTSGGIFESERQDRQMRWTPGTKSGWIHPIDLISAGMALMLDMESPPTRLPVLINNGMRVTGHDMHDNARSYTVPGQVGGPLCIFWPVGRGWVTSLTWTINESSYYEWHVTGTWLLTNLGRSPGCGPEKMLREWSESLPTSGKLITT